MRRELSAATAVWTDQAPVRAAIYGRVLILDGIEKVFCVWKERDQGGGARGRVRANVCTYTHVHVYVICGSDSKNNLTAYGVGLRRVREGVCSV